MTEKKVLTPRGRPRKNNAENGVIAGGLPELITDGRQILNVAALAEVFHWSGYFPDLTPAQIAVHVIAGRSLNLSDAESVFDLQIGPGPSIKWKDGQPFAAVRDTIDAEKNRLSNHAETDSTKRNPAGSVLPGNFAYKHAVLIPDAENRQPVEPAAETLPAAGPGSNADAPDDRPAGERFVLGFGKMRDEMAAETLNRVDANIAAAAAETVSGVGPETIKAWRDGIEAVCVELGIQPTEKTKSFDLANIVEKRKKFEDCQKYYAAKVDELRRPVLDALTASNADTLDARQGFCIYAGVGSDPDQWNYAEAKKAAEAADAYFQKTALGQLTPERSPV